MEEQEATHPLPTAVITMRPWFGYAVVFVILLIGIDIGIGWLAGNAAWSPIRAYVYAAIARLLFTVIITLYAYRRVFDRSLRTAIIVQALCVMLAAFIGATIRFVEAPALWSFVNVVVEPFDSGVLAALIVLMVRWFRDRRTQALPPLTTNFS